MWTFARSSWRRPCHLCLVSASIRPFQRGSQAELPISQWTYRSLSTATNNETVSRRWPNSLVTLAIETSCDDTCVAILEKEVASPAKRPRARLLFEERITADNRAFGGIHPVAASESHTQAIAPLVQRATAFIPPSAAGLAIPDFISVTRGPGMMSSLATGLAMAKGLAVAWQLPLVGVHHMQAHALTPRLVEAMELEVESSAPRVEFPYLSFLVSGGHTMLVHSRSLNDHRILATTTNIAIGDLLDKCARAILPRGYIADMEAKAGRSLPFGALLEAFAFEESGYDDYEYPARRRDEMMPFRGSGWSVEAPLGAGPSRKALKFDFSGINGHIIKLAGGDPPSGGKAAANETVKAEGEVTYPLVPDNERRLLARATMQQAFEHLASRLLLALKTGAGGSGETEGDGEKPTCLVVSGGVASNLFLRHVLRSALDVHGFGHLPVEAPPPSLCTDNAAMIAWTGMEMYEAGWQSDLGIRPIRKWSMDANADDGGILGPDGWIKNEQ